MNEKGIMTYDFIIAIFVFLTAYVITMQIVTYPLTSPNVEVDQKELTNSLLAQTLIKNPGKPGNWSRIDEIQLLGLTLHEKGNNPNILDQTKLEELNETNCSDLEEKIPLKTNINIEITLIEENKTYKCQREGYIPKREENIWAYVWNGEEYKGARGIIQTW
ncbi:MAG: hypothetical protein ACOCTT_00465 [archaeon]